MVGELDWWQLVPKHGPGAIAEGRVDKYDFTTWSPKLQAAFPWDWYGAGSLDQVPDYREEMTPSRLEQVPKTLKGPRLICVEPASNQWMQQAIRRFLEERIGSTPLGRSIDFRSQERSREWALEGSYSGQYATLDLSDASDRLSYRLVQYLFGSHRDLLQAMDAVRTEYVQLPDWHPYRYVKLRKFATMGSALTFPVQSICFTILSVWALRLVEGRWNNWHNWESDFDRVRVFGDDIIVPTHAARATKLVLHECGLLVNDRKSFAGSNFRESCGCDAFKGVDVTPARYRKPYSGDGPSTAALVEFSNNLHLKGWWKLANYVLTWLPPQERKLLWVGHVDEPRLGLVSFCKGAPPPNLRWDVDLQRAYSVRLGFKAKSKRTDPQTMGRLLQYFTEDPSSLPREWEWVPGRPIPTKLQKSKVRVYL
jgi:hypothetical protein